MDHYCEIRNGQISLVGPSSRHAALFKDHACETRGSNIAFGQCGSINLNSTFLPVVRILVSKMQSNLVSQCHNGLKLCHYSNKVPSSVITGLSSAGTGLILLITFVRNENVGEVSSWLWSLNWTRLSSRRDFIHQSWVSSWASHFRILWKPACRGAIVNTNLTALMMWNRFYSEYRCPLLLF